jgi:hypothetical protein
MKSMRSSICRYLVFLNPALAMEGAIAVPLSQTADTPFSAGAKLVDRHLELEYDATCDACTGCHQFKTLMRYPLSGRANELLAMT